jgi:hypothetical protein
VVTDISISSSTDATITIIDTDGTVRVVPRFVGNFDYQRILGGLPQQLTSNSSRYYAFPYAIKIGTSIVGVYSDSESHGSNTNYRMFRSDDSGLTYSEVEWFNYLTPTVFNNTLLDSLMSNGDVIFLRSFRVSKSGGVITVTNQGSTVINSVTYSPWGEVFTLGSAKYRTAYTSSGGIGSSYLLKTTDNGANWTVAGTIAADGGTKFYNESSIAQYTYSYPNAADFEVDTTEYLSRAYASSTDMVPGTGDFSFGGWIKPESFTATRCLIALGNTTSSNPDGYFAQILTTGRIQIGFSDNTGSGSRITMTTTTALVAGTPTHVMFSFDRDGVLTVYFNGIADATTLSLTTRQNACSGHTLFALGASALAALHYDGLMWQWGFWKGKALSASEILSVYNAGKGKAYADLTAGDKTNLSAWWNLSEASGNRSDSQGSNTLTDNNTVTQAAPGNVTALYAIVREDTGSNRPLYYTQSFDSGVQWQTPTLFSSAIDGTQPNLTKLASGTWILLAGDRVGSSGFDGSGRPTTYTNITGISVWKSTDNGVTWTNRMMMDRSWSTDCGQPKLVELADASLVLYWYTRPNETALPVIRSLITKESFIT